MLNNLLRCAVERYDSGMTATRIDSVCHWTQSAAFHATTSIIHATLALGDRVRPSEPVSIAVLLRLGKKAQNRESEICFVCWSHGTSAC